VTWIYFPDDEREGELLGGKASALAKLTAAGLPIPEWFVLSPAAFDQSGELLPDARIELRDALKRLCPNGESTAVRSSAMDEDGASHSFAGQLESYLFISPEDVPDKAVSVWRSGFSERILSYRREHDLSPMSQGPSILVQRMVDAEVSGVAFSADPVSGDRGIAVVASVYGLGTSLVSGESDADTFHVTRNGEIVYRVIANKTNCHRRSTNALDGVASFPVPVTAAALASITDAQILQIAELARMTARHFGVPQDIEWAIGFGRLELLQSRPITSLSILPDLGGERTIWDNSNIVESYGGVTTPLTFSFARKAYEEVYREFCKILGVSHAVIDANQETFSRMLGLINGRIYYNLLNWYRTLSLLPGFKINRGFMEQMMGVREPLPDEIVQELSVNDTRSRFSDGLQVAVAVVNLLISHQRLPSTIEHFYLKLENALRPGEIALADMRVEELAKHYRSLERKLLKSWDAPLINDFFAMVHYGILRQFLHRECLDEGLQNDLVSEQGGMISAVPARRIRTMAITAGASSHFVTLLCEGILNAIHAEMANIPEFKSQFDSYLNTFGDRTLGELKLESLTLHDDPMLLLRSVGNLAKSGPVPPEQEEARFNKAEVAEVKVLATLGDRLIKRAVFYFVLKNAREKLRNRENLRFERTRLFGHARRVFIEIGKRFAANEVLENYRDIFYLEVGEILGFIEGTATTVNLKSLAALRKTEFEGYELMPAPADRFETFGAVNICNNFTSSARAANFNGDLTGIGCSPGIVRARVRVVLDPRQATIVPGEILAAERTDPGWIMFFASAAGLLVERGSLLSHSAIVSREMGIPSIVSIPDLLRRLKTGDLVEMDGSRGTLRIIEAAEVPNVD
jgi:pyruvate,water dikinase